MNPYPENEADLTTFIGNIEDPYKVYAAGSSPESVEDLLRTTIRNLNADDRKTLSVCFLLAAIGQRRTITDILQKTVMNSVSRYVMDHWSIRGNVNFTALNLAGNMIIAAHNLPGTTLMRDWRAKIGGRSLWETNIDSVACRLSEKAKIIAKEKVLRFDIDTVKRYGFALIKLIIMGDQAPPVPGNVPEAVGDLNDGGTPATDNVLDDILAFRVEDVEADTVIPPPRTEMTDAELERYAEIVATKKRKADAIAAGAGSSGGAAKVSRTGTRLTPSDATELRSGNQIVKDPRQQKAKVMQKKTT